MEEETTTPAPVDTGVETTQPVEAVNTEAVITPAVATEEQTTETTEPSDDEQLNKWAESKGLELDSDNAKKAAKMAREAEKAMHSKARKPVSLKRQQQLFLTLMLYK
jgi:hypothetical protein